MKERREEKRARGHAGYAPRAVVKDLARVVHVRSTFSHFKQVPATPRTPGNCAGVVLRCGCIGSVKPYGGEVPVGRSDDRNRMSAG